jgi:peptidoglycan biosynthesis protein MviN/MurJ (putative lipid II flippase)
MMRVYEYDAIFFVVSINQLQHRTPRFSRLDRKGNHQRFQQTSMCHLRLTLALTLPLLFLGQYASPTFANTEIINFLAGDSVPVEPFPKNL